MFPLAPTPPPPVFQPLPHRAVPSFSHPARLPPPHATVPYPYSNDGLVHLHHHAVPPPPPPVLGLQIIPVTAANFEAELDAIGSLLTRYPFVTIDTEYPGTVHRPPSYHKLTPPERYKLVKANVDELPIVQLGITLCDEYGNLPTVVVTDDDGRPLLLELAWEVTFSDFDPRRDRHAPESVAFLASRGVDFDASLARGVSSAAFGAKLAAVLASSSSTPARCGGELTWTAFGGAYDFAYVVKMLSGGWPLPETWHEYVAQARELLGGRVFDAKYMAEHCEREDLCCGGGLRRVAERLCVQRPDLEETPACYCLAGRKSHIACGVYMAMRRRVLYRDGGASHQGLIDGLHH
ncbi:hypothetical protein HU200_022446 [Digitaria exilis]|uniref:poly(A)-specific ribonuclease n=1 Tax=Digitaria exilis TaxID=1010633 RepID=A0A835EYJ4_9POAL|nr:hypothetical protein HU200_022446 [Digitaria exilis]